MEEELEELSKMYDTVVYTFAKGYVDYYNKVKMSKGFLPEYAVKVSEENSQYIIDFVLGTSGRNPEARDLLVNCIFFLILKSGIDLERVGDADMDKAYKQFCQDVLEKVLEG